MKEVKIKSILINSENETTNFETIGKYDSKKGIIKYHEENLEVEIVLEKDRVKINRKNEDYNLNLDFKINQQIDCKHEIKSMGINLDITVTTLKLEIKENLIYIQYKLNNLGLDMGTFEYKLMFWEENIWKKEILK